MDDPISKRYQESNYLEQNPNWDIEDSPWKASKVMDLLRRHNINPKTICEVGCGAGGVLGELSKELINTKLTGFDIAPDAEQFWDKLRKADIELNVGDFFSLDSKHYEAILMLDVLEHVANPHKFLTDIKSRTDLIVIHFPLDLSAISVLLEKPLLYSRHKVGHIHYFTKNLALELLRECGFEIIDFSYTNASLSAPQRSIKTKIFSMFRWVIYLAHKDVGVRLVGGETLMVLAKPKKD